jgi:hypothetical protein
MYYAPQPGALPDVWDYSSFHAGDNCNVVSVAKSGWVYVCCTTCHVLAEVQAVATRIDANSSKEAKQ